MDGQLSLADTPAAPPGPLVRVRADVAYHGAAFRGFAAQGDATTVEGRLGDVLDQILGWRPSMSAAGRTDAGVHARGQVVSFDVPVGTDVEALARSVTSMLRPAVVMSEARVVSEGFDARTSATSRTYRYRLLDTTVPDPLRHDQTWHVGVPLDLSAMVLACDPLIGEQDFACMCRRPPPLPDGRSRSLYRRVFSASWRRVDDELVFQITANAFCHQMVRSIVGAHVAVGRHDLRAGELRERMAAGTRRQMPAVAPPQGLCLWSVSYDGDRVHPPPRPR